jgi:NitT/TauT family transport system ATP-binding protein
MWMKVIIMIDLIKVGKIYYTRGKPIESLHDISFKVSDGEFVSIVGPSGCGKSTLVKIISDIIKPTSGQIFIDGNSPDDARKKRAFGIVFQDPVLMAWRTNIENVCLPLEVVGAPFKERQQKSLQLLELVGLSDFAHKLPRELSGGMRQRVSIARALSVNPKILLMDEPFGALDEITRDRMNMEIQDIWNKTKKTILFVTHSVPEAVLLSDKVVVMSKRPGLILETVNITLSRPRTLDMREESAFLGLVRQIRMLLSDEC